MHTCKSICPSTSTKSIANQQEQSGASQTHKKHANSQENSSFFPSLFWGKIWCKQYVCIAANVALGQWNLISVWKLKALFNLLSFQSKLMCSKLTFSVLTHHLNSAGFIRNLHYWVSKIFFRILYVCIHANVCAWDKCNISLNRKAEQCSPCAIVPKDPSR